MIEGVSRLCLVEESHLEMLSREGFGVEQNLEIQRNGLSCGSP